jgi:hypothetical protein
MIRLSIIPALALLLVATEAFNVGNSVSSFGGSVLVTGVSNVATMEMKKGKANVPPQMRGQYKKQQEMKRMRDQMVEASRPGPDGLPVFNLYVRTKKNQVSWNLHIR